MLNTAAGTVAAARVFVIGAGVAGLQAIATARRLGARVEAYDVRPAVKEQIQSLGARFVELPIEAGDAQDAGGYAKAQDESFYRRQRELMLKTVAGDRRRHHDRRRFRARRRRSSSPKRWCAAMPPGSVIVDLAAATGGNCELTVADETVVRHGVTIIGPTNLPATVPYHASQMYARNVVTLIQHLVQREKGPDGKPTGAPRLVARPERRDHERDPRDQGRRGRAPAGASARRSRSSHAWLDPREQRRRRRSSSACRPAASRPSAAPRAPISSSMRPSSRGSTAG